MRIVLIYPPPWKIPARHHPLDHPEHGPPEGLDSTTILSGDILHIPYGLLTLAAQARRAGHEVSVLNLFSLPWHEIISVIDRSRAALYGLSCFTANRRGTVYLARLIRELYPAAHIAVGGPHATALPGEMLAFCEAIDTIITGEGEQTFAELVTRIEQGARLSGLPGTVRRANDTVTTGSPRRPVDDLDCLASPFDYFSEHILITSRGCPWNCTFCSSRGMWGTQVRRHAPKAVLGMLETIVNTHGQKAVAIKDETFTLHRDRVLDICRGILQRRLNFLWSCDTRADALDEEMLWCMRAAGCQRISLGVESGSPRILKRLNKQLDLGSVRKATALAKKFGFQVRFYMIVGSQGETFRTLQESVAFVNEVRPHQVIWNPFTLLPGTPEFLRAETQGTTDRRIFFTDTFFEYVPLLHDSGSRLRRSIADWLMQRQGLQTVGGYTRAERESILERFPDLPAARLEVGAACYDEADPQAAGGHILQALDCGYPLRGIGHNYLACIAADRGDFKKALQQLITARQHGWHQVVEENIVKARHWIKQGGPYSGAPLRLKADCCFEVTRPLRQPTTPGKIKLGEILR